jgi:uncharacterized protein (DUF3084 family)
MRRVIFAVLGTVELVIAVVLVYTAINLPSSTEVARGFDRAEETTRKASHQVTATRRQVSEVRRPEVQQLAGRLRTQTETVTKSLRSQQVNFDTVVSLRNSLKDVSTGLDGVADSFDAERFAKLGQSLGDTAKYLDEKLLPATDRSAEQFEKLSSDLSKDAEALSKLLKTAPPDLKAARDIHDSLSRFDDGLDKMMKLIELKRLDAIKDGFAGLETSLETTAGEVEKLAGYKYPHVKVRGLKVDIEEKPFWQNGDKVAEGLRKATEGVRAAQKELDGVGKELPAIRAALEESRKVVARTRAALGKTLEQQNKLEPLLRDIPTRTAGLAEAVPMITGDLAKVLRETKQLRNVAASLKDAQKGLDAAAGKWPELRQSLKQTAKVLRSSAEQLDRVVAHRDDYEASVKQSTELAETFSLMVPLLTDQLDADLGEQEKTLRDLESSLDDVGNSVPTFKRSALDLLTTGRLLLWLTAAAVGLHGGFLLVENWRVRQYGNR